MYALMSKQRFETLVLEACGSDADLRHEIERRKDYGYYAEAAEAAYNLFCKHFLSIREAFGLTAKG